MAIFPVVFYPDPVLLRRAPEVPPPLGEREKILIRDMIDTMYAQKGVGLAANQVGISQRIFVANPEPVRGREIVILNPEIVKGKGGATGEEGCLSLPGMYHRVKRYSEVILKGMSPDGKPVEIKATGLLARIFQHETDHLNGFLFIHRLPFFKRRAVLKELSRSRA